MPITETIWKIEPHTQVKHAILERYLQAWLPILSRWNGRILYIDGFAGPGKYLDDNNKPTIDGSPLIAINTAIRHKLPLAKVLFLFIEKEADRYEYLVNLLKSIDLPQNMEYKAKLGKFDEHVSYILDVLDEQKKSLAPAFVFIDPFGYMDTPFSLVKRIMEINKCEVLITFTYRSLIQWGISKPDQHEHVNELFGTDKWKKALEISNPSEKKEFLIRLYQKQLENFANIAYVRFFEMINKSNQAEYFLFFGTNKIDGLRAMIRSMYKVDQEGEFKFSDRTNPNQAVLFSPTPNYSLLKKLLNKKFKSKTVPIEEVEEFALITGFVKFKREVLRLMEYSDPPQIKAFNRKIKGTYPPGTTIKFS
ncbi:hypothetical protein ES703_40022 [subsurface metagenome]